VEGVPCSPINTVAEALADPQVLARNLVYYVEHPTLGRVGQVASPVRFGDQEPLRRLAPALGQDTEQVLVDLLGYSAGHIGELARAGVVSGPGLTAT
jgi:crotonobetainyl-CoA:carnitine CoA-transferase CaiB-like acyl-CoA transferase